MPLEPENKQIPQTQTVDQFAERIKRKFPQYQDVDNAKLVAAVVEKYPVYGQQIEGYKKKDSTESPSTGVAGSAPSAGEEVKLDSSVRDDIKIVEDSPNELQRLWNRAIATSEVGKIIMRGAEGFEIDYDELAYYQKVLAANAKQEDDWLYDTDSGAVGNFMLDLISTIPESLITMADAGLSPEAISATIASGAAGSVIPGIGTAIGAAAGFAASSSVMSEYGNSLIGLLQEEGIDVLDADALEAAFNNEETIASLKARAGSRATVISILDGLSGGISGKVGKSVLKAGAKTAARQKLKAEIAEQAVEGSLGASGEALGSLAAGQEIDWRDVALEGLADPSQGLSGRAIKSIIGKKKGDRLTDSQKFINDKLEINRDRTFGEIEVISATNDEIIAVGEHIKNLKNALKKEGLNASARKSIENQINKLTTKKTELQAQQLVAFDNLTDEQSTELSQDLDNVLNLREAVNAEGLTDVEKAALEAEAKAAYEALVEKKNQMLGEPTAAPTPEETPTQPAAKETPTVAEPKVEEQPVADKPAVEEPVAEEPTVSEPVEEAPAVDETVVEEVKAEEGLKTEDGDVIPQEVVDSFAAAHEMILSDEIADIQKRSSFDRTPQESAKLGKLTKMVNKAHALAEQHGLNPLKVMRAVQDKMQPDAPTVLTPTKPEATKPAKDTKKKPPKAPPAPAPAVEKKPKVKSRAHVEKAAPRKAFKKVQAPLIATDNGYVSQLSKTDKKGKKITYDIDVFVDPKTEKVTYSISRNGKATTYTDIRGFRDAVNKQVRDGAEPTDSILRKRQETTAVEKPLTEDEKKAAKEENKALKTDDKRSYTAVWKTRDGKERTYKVNVLGRTKQKHQSYATVREGNKVVRRFATKEQYTNWYNNQLSRRDPVITEHKKVATAPKKEAVSEVSKVEDRKAPAPEKKPEKPTAKKKKLPSNVKPYKIHTHYVERGMPAVLYAYDKDGNKRLFTKDFDKDTLEHSYFEVEEKSIAGVKRFETIGKPLGNNKRDITTALRAEAKPVKKVETKVETKKEDPRNKPLTHQERAKISEESRKGGRQFRKEDRAFAPETREELDSMSFEQIVDATNGYAGVTLAGDPITDLVYDNLYAEGHSRDTMLKKIKWYQKYIDESLNVEAMKMEGMYNMSLSERLNESDYVAADNVDLGDKASVDKLREGFKVLNVDLDQIARDWYYDKYLAKDNKTTLERSELADAGDGKNAKGVLVYDIIRGVHKARKILAKFAPHVRIITHKDTAAFDAAMNKHSVGGANRRSEGGRFIKNKNTGLIEIHINLEQAKATTPVHEAFHAFFYERYKQNPVIAKQLASRLKTALERGNKSDRAIAQQLDEFVRRYDENVRGEEYMAELAGIMAEAQTTLSKSSMNKVVDAIRKFILRIAKTVGYNSEYIAGLTAMMEQDALADSAADFMRGFVSGAEDVADGSNDMFSAPFGESDVNVSAQVEEMSHLTEGEARVKYGSFTVDHFQSSEQIREGKESGRIKMGVSFEKFVGKPSIMHEPDNSFVGTVMHGNRPVVEGMGGVLFPERFKGSFWASTKDTAQNLADKLNMARALSPDGKVRLLLTAGGKEKLLSATVNVRGSLEVFDVWMSELGLSVSERKAFLMSVYNDMFRVSGKARGAISAITFERQAILAKPEDTRTKEEAVSLAKYNKALDRLSEMGIIKYDRATGFAKPIATRNLTINNLETILFEVLDAESSTFSGRKDIADRMAASFVNVVKNSPKAKSRKEAFIKSTGVAGFAANHIRTFISEMFTEPIVDGVDKGMVYAVLEVDSEVEAVSVKGHPSYPSHIRIKEDGKPVTISFLETPVNPHNFDVYDYSKDTVFKNKYPKTEAEHSKLSREEHDFRTFLRRKQADTILPPTAGVSDILTFSPTNEIIDKQNGAIDTLAPYRQNINAYKTSRVTRKSEYAEKMKGEWTMDTYEKSKAAKSKASRVRDLGKAIALENGYAPSKARIKWADFKAEAELRYEAEKALPADEHRLAERSEFTDNDTVDGAQIPPMDSGKDPSVGAEFKKAVVGARQGIKPLFMGLGGFFTGLLERGKKAGLFYTETQKTVLRFLESMDSQMSRQASAVRKLAKQVRKYAKDTETLDLAYDYLTAPTLAERNAIAEQLAKKPDSEKMLAALDGMRSFVDGISETFLSSHLFDSLPETGNKKVVKADKKKDGKVVYNVVNTTTDDVIAANLTKTEADKIAQQEGMRDVIRRNLGSYLHTSYRFFKNKDYKITQKSWSKAVKGEYELAKLAELKKLMDKGMTEQQAMAEIAKHETVQRLLKAATESIREYVREIEALRADPDFHYSGISAGAVKIPKSVFQRKKGIPEHIQTLLGKEKDPTNAFIDTSLAMMKTLYKTEMIYKVSEALGGTFVKNEVTTEELNSGNWKKVSDPHSPVDGKWVQTEVFEMLDSKPLLQHDNVIFNTYFKLLKLMRKSKVVWNLPTWRKNLTGGWFFIAANGKMNKQFIADLKARVDRTFKGEANPEVEALLDEMAELGLIGADVNANLIDLNDAALAMLVDDDIGKAEGRAKKLWSKLKNTDSKLAEKYTAIDDYTKLIIYRIERESFAKKLYGAEYASLTEAQQKKVREGAGEFVKQNTPTFSRLPKWYRTFAKMPFGDFLGFKLEAYRSIWANFKNASADIKKASDASLGDAQRAEYRRAGLARLFGSIGTLSARMVVPAIMTSLFLDDEDDEEIAEDVVKIRPDWMEGHSLIVKSISDDGTVAVYNYSMEDPYGEVTDILRGDLSTFEDFIQPNMLVKLYSGIAKGQDAYGRDITDPSDPLMYKWMKRVGYVAKQAVIPPSISSSIRHGENQMIIRDYKYNVGQQFYFNARKYTKGTPYNELSGSRRNYRLQILDDIREQYEAVMRIGTAKGNVQILLDANKVLNRFNRFEQAYIKAGITIDE